MNRTILLLPLALALVSCGQMGPLVMPASGTDGPLAHAKKLQGERVTWSESDTQAGSNQAQD